MKTNTTQRGFRIIEFKDYYEEDCSIQKSSLADDDCIWLGIDNPEPRIMCKDAIKLGLRKATGGEEDNGWCDFKVPEEVSFTTRMHLNREQVQFLIPILQKFVKNGELPAIYKPLKK
jgi:hypothetical protein